MKPPVGKIGDCYFVGNVCDICFRHFLIEIELIEHYETIHAKKLVLEILSKLEIQIHDLEDK